MKFLKKNLLKDVRKNEELYKKLMLLYIDKLSIYNDNYKVKSILDKYYIEILKIFSDNVLLNDIFRIVQSVIITNILLKKVLSSNDYKSFKDEFGINFLTINYLLPGNALYNSIVSNNEKK